MEHSVCDLAAEACRLVLGYLVGHVAKGRLEPLCGMPMARIVKVCGQARRAAEWYQAKVGEVHVQPQLFLLPGQE